MERNQTISDALCARFNKLLRPPVFKDEEKTRIAMILGVVLWSIVAVISILIITWLITGKSRGLGPCAFAATACDFSTSNFYNNKIKIMCSFG